MPTKEVCDVNQFQHNSKIPDEKGNQFNIKEVVNFLRQGKIFKLLTILTIKSNLMNTNISEWDLVSNENLSNRPVYFNSN